jgi:hypothetical protein
MYFFFYACNYSSVSSKVGPSNNFVTDTASIIPGEGNLQTIPANLTPPFAKNVDSSADFVEIVIDVDVEKKDVHDSISSTPVSHKDSKKR